jgi:hypothetical protein
MHVLFITTHTGDCFSVLLQLAACCIAPFPLQVSVLAAAGHPACPQATQAPATATATAALCPTYHPAPSHPSQGAVTAAAVAVAASLAA